MSKIDRSDTAAPAVGAQVDREVRRLAQMWHKCIDRMPEQEDEVLVWIDGHRGPAWRNSHALVAYVDLNGNWCEQRHPACETLAGVIAWAHIDEPDA